MNLATAVEFHQEIARLQAEIERLRLAIHRLAYQDATLSVVGGNVIVEMDATLTDAEREAVELFASLAWTSLRWSEVEQRAATLRGLLERLR